MEPRFQQRKEQLLADCQVPPTAFRGAVHRLEIFAQPFVASLPSPESQRHTRTYLAGLLSDLEHKNAEAIAYRSDLDRQALQHYLGTAHTLANFESAFYRSDTADNSSFEQWLDDGGLDAAQRASRLWRSRLDAYEPPPIDDAIDAELIEFIDRRKAELPDTFA